MSEYTEGGAQDDTISEGSGHMTEAETFDKKVLVKDTTGYTADAGGAGGTSYQTHKTTTTTSNSTVKR